jgi:hypothetical protein
MGVSPPTKIVTIGNRQILMFSIPTMIKEKLADFYSRQGDNDMQDIEWLADKHEKVLIGIRDDLDYEQRKFFFRAVLEERGWSKATDRLKRILGVEW